VVLSKAQGLYIIIIIIITITTTTTTTTTTTAAAAGAAVLVHMLTACNGYKLRICSSCALLCPTPGPFHAVIQNSTVANSYGKR
jgi:hypothetical protein